MALKKCMGCGIPLGSDAKSCPQCGMTQSEECKCAHCGADLQAGMRFCPECGQAVPEGTTQQASQAQAPGVLPAAAAQSSSVNVDKPQNAPQNFASPSPQNFAPPQGAGAQPVSAPPMQTSSAQTSPTGGQPMLRPTNVPPLGAAGGPFGAGANAAGAGGAAGALGEWKEKLLSFEGRLNRKPYVLRLLAVSVVSVVSSVVVQIVSFIPGMIIAAIGQSFPDLGMVLTFFRYALMFFRYAIIFVLCLLATVIGISLGIRRCHDNDWSGWLVLLSFVPLVNIVFGLLLLFKPGTPGPNRFGPDPLH